MKKLISMRLSAGLTLGFIATLLMGACSRPTARSPENQAVPSPVSAASVRAADRVEDSFGRVFHSNPQLEQFSGPLSPQEDRYRVSLAKTALEKEFLLQASMILQLPAAAGNGLKSRVVAFRQRGGRLFLMEATDGHSVTSDLPQNLILAEFPVLQETDRELVFDFNSGMSRLFLMSDWHAQDDGGGEPDASAAFGVAPIAMSYLETVELTTSNKLYIRQVAQADAGSNIVPVEVRYWLSPYRPNPGFTPTVSRDFNQFGFFEVAMRYGRRGEPLALATKFDHNRPVVFAVSSNTPPAFRAAVREGVLYWNKAFGREVIQVVDAPVDRTAPDGDFNIVQWVDWDTAGFAYADAQSDPRTGETLQASVFMTSVFAVSSLQEARRLLQRADLQSNGPGARTARRMRFSLRGFDENARCHRESPREWLETLREVVSSGQVDDARVLQIAQDHVREVVAHEVGHTLGARHNFAGSLASNQTPEGRKAVIQQYLRTGEVDAAVQLTSSTMDYNWFEDSAIAGRQLLGERALDYDAKFVATLYHGERFSITDSPLFCTDSHVGQYFDCRRFDVGRTPVEIILHDMEASELRALRAWVRTHLTLKVASLRGQQVRPAGDELATVAGWLGTADILVGQALSTDTKVLSHRFRKSWSELLDTDSLRAQEVQEFLRGLESVGGLEILLAPHKQAAVEKLENRIQDYLERHGYGLYLGGDRVVLTPQDREGVVGILRANRPAVVNLLANGFVASVQSIPTTDDGVASALQTLVGAFAEEVLLSTRNAPVPGQVTFPQFLYRLDVRQQAASVLTTAPAGWDDWALPARTQIRQRGQELLNQFLGSEPAQASLSRAQRLELQGATALLESLTP